MRAMGCEGSVSECWAFATSGTDVVLSNCAVSKGVEPGYPASTAWESVAKSLPWKALETLGSLNDVEGLSDPRPEVCVSCIIFFQFRRRHHMGGIDQVCLQYFWNSWVPTEFFSSPPRPLLHPQGWASCAPTDTSSCVCNAV